MSLPASSLTGGLDSALVGFQIAPGGDKMRNELFSLSCDDLPADERHSVLSFTTSTVACLLLTTVRGTSQLLL